MRGCCKLFYVRLILRFEDSAVHRASEKGCLIDCRCREWVMTCAGYILLQCFLFFNGSFYASLARLDIYILHDVGLLLAPRTRDKPRITFVRDSRRWKACFIIITLFFCIIPAMLNISIFKRDYYTNPSIFKHNREYHGTRREAGACFYKQRGKWSARMDYFKRHLLAFF